MVHNGVCISSFGSFSVVLLLLVIFFLAQASVALILSAAFERGRAEVLSVPGNDDKERLLYDVGEARDLCFWHRGLASPAAQHLD
jgi:hypothetical protein